MDKHPPFSYHVNGYSKTCFGVDPMLAPVMPSNSSSQLAACAMLESLRVSVPAHMCEALEAARLHHRLVLAGAEADVTFPSDLFDASLQLFWRLVGSPDGV